MAVLRSLSALTRRQRLIMQANAPKPRTPRPVYEYDAHVQAHRDWLIANHAKVLHIKTTGKPLKAQKWFQPDYRSATPKGLPLLSDKLRGVHKRFGVN